MRIRVFVATAILLALTAFFSVHRNGQSLRLQRTGGMPLGAQAQPCGCPPMPVIATSKDPAKGHVHYELTHGDLEDMFSNRHILFARDWDDALAALAHEIDPSGKYGIAKAPAPKIVRQAPLVEGGFSEALLHPPALTPFGTRRAPRNGGRWAELTSSRTLITYIIGTLARINKYGEPAKGLRTALLAIARFFVDDLATIPVAVAQQDPKGQFAQSSGDDARSTLAGELALVTRSALNNSPRDEPPVAGELALDRFDRANAALDILMSADESGRQSDVFVLNHPAAPDHNNEALFDLLVEIASAQAQFGGNAPPGSPQDSVACRAFAILTAASDARQHDSKQYRDLLVGDIYNQEVLGIGYPKADPPRLATARIAFIMAGVADGKEAEQLVKTVQSFALGGHESDDTAQQDGVRKEVVGTIRSLIQNAGGTRGATFRAEMAAKAEELFKHLEDRKNAGTGTSGEARLLDAWKSGGESKGRATVGGACGPPPGPSKGTIFLYAVTNAGLQSIKRPYIGVPMIVEAQFDPPSGEAEVELDVDFGGGTTKMKLQRFDPNGYIYRSDPVLPSEPKSKEPVFNPPLPPKRDSK